MHNKHLKRGFTLIELLVVVLIIGILSAVALPQYQKAVEKSRITEALQMISQMSKMCDLCYLEKGEDNCVDLPDMEDTGISIGEVKTSGGPESIPYVKTKDWAYEIVGCGEIDAIRAHSDGSYGDWITYYKFGGPDNVSMECNDFAPDKTPDTCKAACGNSQGCVMSYMN